MSHKAALYAKVAEELRAFFAKYEGIDVTARMATVNSFLKYHFPDWVFCGFYTVLTSRDAILQIGPYQGRVLATALIPFGKGVCGTAAEEGKTQIVSDVSVCNNYIPCDDVTRSEIVLPVFGHHYHDERAGASAPAQGSAKKLIAVLDIDSEELGGFDEEDARSLEALLAEWF